MIRSKCCWPWKSKPSDDAPWLAGFTSGFNRALDLAVPLLHDGSLKVKEAIETQAVETALARLEPLIEQRLASAEHAHLRPANELLAKQQEVRQLLSRVTRPEERAKYQAVLEFIEWVLHGD